MTEPDRSTAWPYDEHGEPTAFVYQRNAHPTGAEAERLLGEREGGTALLFGSGTSATSACVVALCKPGDTIALAAGAYYGTAVTLRRFEPWGLRVVEYDQTGAPPADADIVWVESPANPTLTEPHWEAVAAFDGLVVCDATLSTPVYLRALDRGADIVLHSATKYLTGRHDAMLGALVTRDDARAKRLWETRRDIGLAAAPDAAASLIRGLGDLDERLHRQTETATEVARRLEAHPAVQRVRYPGYSGVISFDVEDPRAVETATGLIRNQTSLGGVHSTIESRWRWEGDRIPRGLLRLSVGVEDVEELWADLAAALGRTAHPRNL